MRIEINPKETTRAQAFELWMSSPMPMVTLVKTLDVTHLVRICRRKGKSFNTMMCWCIGKAASMIPEFKDIPYDYQGGYIPKYVTILRKLKYNEEVFRGKIRDFVYGHIMKNGKK